MTAQRRSAALVDPLIGFGLLVAYVTVLLATADDLGYARDEGFYVQAAKAYGRWFALLFEDPARAMTRAAVDRHWATNSEHPAFVKSLFALSYQLLHVKWKVFAEEGTAFRFPGMVLSGLAVAVTYAWGARVLGRMAGLVAALSFACMPRVFYHAHLDCFDMPVVAMWLVTTYAYWRSLEPGSLTWAIAAGVLYGLFLNTKHNSWLLPGALIAHFVLARGTAFWRELARGRVRAPLALLCMATLGPALFYALWPWIWRDTGQRLADYAQFHLAHEYYNMEFLGVTYWEPPMSRWYAPLMTVATVPAITLALSGLGGFVMLRRFASARLGGEAPSAASPAPWAPRLLWLFCIVLSYAPWLSSSTPIFGGTKHWMTAYPFMALFAADGFVAARDALGRAFPRISGSPRVAAAVLAGLVLVGPATMAWSSHPFGLSAYTPVVGGAPGAATLGLNRTFWGYTTGAVAGHLDETAPKGASVFLHDTAFQSWAVMAHDGRVRRDLRPTLDIVGSDLALYHHEPHMARVEYQIWTSYGTTRPSHVGTHHGVPVVWVFSRPGGRRSSAGSE